MGPRASIMSFRRKLIIEARGFSERTKKRGSKGMFRKKTIRGVSKKNHRGILKNRRFFINSPMVSFSKHRFSCSEKRIFKNRRFKIYSLMVSFSKHRFSYSEKRLELRL